MSSARSGARKLGMARGIVSSCVPEIAFGDDSRGAGEAGQKLPKRLLDLQNNTRAARCDQRHIAAELNGVAKSLLAVKQDGLIGDLVASEPERLREIAP